MSELEGVQADESQMDDGLNKRMKGEIERKREKIRSNYETIEALKSRLEENKRMDKVGMTRAAYLKMIFDATQKVDKQNQELIRAIMDTRQMQRDINNLNGRLDRSFAVVKDMIAKVIVYLIMFKVSIAKTSINNTYSNYPACVEYQAR